MKQKKTNKKVKICAKPEASTKAKVNKKVKTETDVKIKTNKKASINNSKTDKSTKINTKSKSEVKPDTNLKVRIGSKMIELPNNYDPRKETGKYMCERQQAYFKIKLQNWLNDIKEKLAAENVDDVNADYRSTDESDQMVMEGHILTELRSKDRLRKLAKKIEEFIGKIEADTYGYCEETGNEIGINRLMVRPIARFCIEIQEKKDREEEEREFLEQNIEEEKSKVIDNTQKED